MKKIKLLIALSVITVSLRAQSLTPQVISSSGAFYSNGSGMLSTTIGELAAVTTLSGGSYYLTQGFQQPWDFGVGIPELNGTDFALEIYPNPGNGMFYLSVNTPEDSKLKIHIYDVLGKTIFSENVNSPSGGMIHELNLRNFNSGIYFLEVSGEKNIHFSRKIQITN